MSGTRCRLVATTNPADQQQVRDGYYRRHCVIFSSSSPNELIDQRRVETPARAKAEATLTGMPSSSSGVTPAVISKVWCRGCFISPLRPSAPVNIGNRQPRHLSAAQRQPCHRQKARVVTAAARVVAVAVGQDHPDVITGCGAGCANRRAGSLNLSTHPTSRNRMTEAHGQNSRMTWLRSPRPRPTSSATNSSLWIGEEYRTSFARCTTIRWANSPLCLTRCATIGGLQLDRFGNTSAPFAWRTSLIELTNLSVVVLLASWQGSIPRCCRTTGGSLLKTHKRTIATRTLTAAFC